MNKIVFCACLFSLTILSACAPLRTFQEEGYKYEKPRVAILEFDNKASLTRQWNLSNGMRDLLVDALVKTNRYTVLTRKDLDVVLSELDIQQNSAFRKEGKLQQGKLKNLQYLVKGAVTDFSHIGGGALRVIGSKLGIGGSGDVAVVSVTIYVIEVESGEIVASRSMEGRASAGSVGFNATYKNVGFGGKAFFRTPLGKATQEVMEECLIEIGKAIATKEWHPSVVKVDGSRTIISGGLDRQIVVGSEWTVYTEGEQLVDPKTGDVLGREPGVLSGRIQVTEVQGKYSVAEILDGDFQTGQILWPIAPVVKEKPGEKKR